jgi:hypothetical protein
MEGPVGGVTLLVQDVCECAYDVASYWRLSLEMGRVLDAVIAVLVSTGQARRPAAQSVSLSFRKSS